MALRRPTSWTPICNKRTTEVVSGSGGYDFQIGVMVKWLRHQTGVRRSNVQDPAAHEHP